MTAILVTLFFIVMIVIELARDRSRHTLHESRVKRAHLQR